MTEKSRIYFHLGLPKTASTYLQKTVFPQLQGVVFHKKHDFRKYKGIASDDPHIHLFSSEMDIGIEDELKRIKNIHPMASVMIVFRSHYSWILSKYKYSIRKWNHLRMAEYYSSTDDKLLKVPTDYYRGIIELADELFDGRVLVMNYHLLKSDPGFIEGSIQDFIGIQKAAISPGKHVNKAFNTRQLIHLRRYNEWHRYRESQSKFKFFRKLYYRYRQYLLHIVAFFSKAIPVDELEFKEELKREKLVIEERYKNDWAFVRERSGIVKV